MLADSTTAGTLDLPDLTDRQTFADGVPFEAFDQMRSMPGLYWQTAQEGTRHGGYWVLTRTEDCLELERHPELFSSKYGCVWPWTTLPLDSDWSLQLMHRDPPEHSATRRVVAKAFGPRVVANFESWVREIVTDALDDVVSGEGQFDYIQKVATPIPSRVIGRVMGFPRSDEHIIVESTTEIFGAAQLEFGEETEAIMVAAMNRLYGYIADVLVPAKRLNPTDDMCSVLTKAMDNGELTLAEGLEFHRLLVNAGFETTHTLIGQSMRLMLEDPEVLETVYRAIDEVGPDRVVDEFLRYISPAMNFARTATQDTELAGQKIREGDLLVMWYIAANRDPATFTDPNRFDPWRDEPGSLVFGSAHHRCLGAVLAKLELRILFEEMRKRDIRLRLDGPPQRGWSTFINQLTALPVTLISGR